MLGHEAVAVHDGDRACAAEDFGVGLLERAAHGGVERGLIDAPLRRSGLDHAAVWKRRGLPIRRIDRCFGQRVREFGGGLAVSQRHADAGAVDGGFATHAVDVRLDRLGFFIDRDVDEVEKTRLLSEHLFRRTPRHEYRAADNLRHERRTH